MPVRMRSRKRVNCRGCGNAVLHVRSGTYQSTRQLRALYAGLARAFSLRVGSRIARRTIQHDAP